MKCRIRNSSKIVFLSIRWFNLLDKTNFQKNIFNETKVYFLNNEIFDTKCSIIPEIELVEKVDRCTNDLLVKFNHNNQQKTGFLTYKKIIRNSSYIIPCILRKNIIQQLVKTYKYSPKQNDSL